MAKTLVSLLAYLSSWIQQADGVDCTAGGSRRLESSLTGFEISSPKHDTLVPDPVYLAAVGDVDNVEQFQSHNGKYHFCIHSYDEEGNTMYQKCNLSVYDTHYVSINSASSRSSNGPRVIEVSLMHVDVGLLCIDRVTVHCCVAKAKVDHSSDSENENEDQMEDKAKRDGFVAYHNLHAILEDKEEKSNKAVYTHQTALVIESTLHKYRACDGSHSHSSSPLKPLNVFIGIKSSALNIGLRQAIRSTWFTLLTSEGMRCRAVNYVPLFLIGSSSHAAANETIAALLQREQERYADLLLGSVDQLDVYDSYYNLPDKVLSGIAWIMNLFSPSPISPISPISPTTPTSPHPIPDYIIICDDDVYLDTFTLSQYLQFQAPRTR